MSICLNMEAMRVNVLKSCSTGLGNRCLVLLHGSKLYVSRMQPLWRMRQGG